MRADTMDLKEDRADCRRESGAAHAACEREVRIDKAQKQDDVAAFRQDKAMHQADSATLQAMHRKTRADKRAMGN